MPFSGTLLAEFVTWRLILIYLILDNMKRRVTKEKEEEVAVQSGTSGDEVALPAVEEDSPTSSKVKDVIAELAQAKTPLELMMDRVS